MLTRVLIVAVVAVAAMVAVKDGRVLRSSGLTGSCSLVQVAPDGTSWNRCVSGKLEGRPDLTNKSCTSEGVDGKYELWHCPAALAATAAPRR